MSPSETVTTSFKDPTSAASHVGRWLVWMPVLAWLLGAACLAGLGFAIDFSGIEQSPDSWGYLAGAVILSVMYGPPVLLAAFGCAMAGSLFASARARIACATAGAAIVAIGGLALVVFMSVFAFGEEPAGQVFGAGAVVIGVALLVPLILCLRLRATRLGNNP